MCFILFQSTIKSVLYFVIIYCVCCTNVNCFVLPSNNIKYFNHDSRDSFILTPLIEQNKIVEARTVAEVNFKEFNNTKCYAGYFTVDPRYNSNLFFWFFPSQENYENAPVILWLQGGPGVSSLYGLFTENGPLTVSPDGRVSQRELSWTKTHSVIYIDNPVGTGFSFTDEGGYARNETIIGKHLYQALLQFYRVFPELQNNDFYVTGESYAGKYVPALAYTIHKNNPFAVQRINLQGLAIGNGWTDPIHQTGYAEYLYQIGLIDSNVKQDLEVQERNLITYIHHKRWENAKSLGDIILTTIMEADGLNNYYNYLVSKDAGTEPYETFLQRKDVRLALHVGNKPFVDFSGTVQKMLRQDEMQSVAPLVSELLSHYRVLLYTGQLDIVVAYPLTINYLKHLNFTGAEEYKSAPRHQWNVKDDVAGYVKQAGNLTEILVRNAGHMVPADQPSWALDMITRFTHNEPFY